MDYLCAHSALFRGLLSGASPFDLAMEAPTSTLAGLSPQPSSSPLRFPCILPSSTCSHPVIHLPVPDPASFHHVVHYIYFGSTSFMEEALENGDLTWDGLARNVEYLKMGDDIKLFLARYWRRVHTYCDYSDSDSDCDYDSDYDSDNVCMSEDESTLADPDEDHMCLADDEEDDMLVLKAKAQARARDRDPPRGGQQVRLWRSSVSRSRTASLRLAPSCPTTLLVLAPSYKRTRTRDTPICQNLRPRCSGSMRSFLRISKRCAHPPLPMR